jgi:hypothetical protein
MVHFAGICWMAAISCGAGAKARVSLEQVVARLKPCPCYKALPDFSEPMWLELPWQTIAALFLF